MDVNTMTFEECCKPGVGEVKDKSATHVQNFLDMVLFGETEATHAIPSLQPSSIPFSWASKGIAFPFVILYSMLQSYIEEYKPVIIEVSSK